MGTDWEPSKKDSLSAEASWNYKTNKVASVLRLLILFDFSSFFPVLKIDSRQQEFVDE
jgi:hypothetical protein